MLKISPTHFLLFAAVLCILMGVSVKCQYSYKKLTVNVTKLFVDFDFEYVSHFTLKEPESGTYVFEIVRKIPTFFLELKMSAVETKRVLLHMKGINGCEFMKNPLTSSFFNKMIKGITGAEDSFQCPLNPRNYTLVTKLTQDFVPPMHPTGGFVFDTKCKLEPNNRTLLHLNWNYRVARNS